MRPGDRVVLLLDPSVELTAALHGVWRAGAIAVPVHRALKPRQVRHIVEDSGAYLVVSSRERFAELGLSGSLFCDVDATDVDAELPTALDGDDEPAAILYTSGSTGLPKGILVSHANLIAGAEIVSEYLELDERDRLLALLPFSFDYGLNQLLCATHVGAQLVFQRSTLPADVCRTLEAEEVTVMAAVPPLWLAMTERFSPFSRMSFPKLRAITNSGGAFPKELTARMRELLPDVRIFLM